MVQIGSAIGSTTWADGPIRTPNNIRTLVACGAAGGDGRDFQRPDRGQRSSRWRF